MRRTRPTRQGTIVALPRPAAAAVQAMQRFLQVEASGGILLIGAAIVALLMANSPLEEFYDHFRELPVQVQVGDFGIAKPLLLWINDGLMAIFFLLVSLEIKREAMSGQLSTRAQVMLPVICAFAGVLVPALIYAGFNRGDAETMRGWAIPTATDIAFALGVLSLLGSRVPLGMKVLLSTIAVVDDLVAILIIAVFYSHGLSVGALGWAGVALAVMFLLNRRGVTALTPYLLLGAFLWICVLKSGVHATLAGVATGLMIPHARRRDADGDGIADDSEETPLEELEHALHPWVAYLILPLFALANAGLALGDFTGDDLASAVPLGIALGLVLGKPVGIVGAAVAARALGIASFPEGMDWKAMVGLGLLCGIGFTMSLFIGGLAFGGAGDLFSASVLGVLVASTIAAVAGFAWLRIVLPDRAAADRGPCPRHWSSARPANSAGRCWRGCGRNAGTWSRCRGIPGTNRGCAGWRASCRHSGGCPAASTSPSVADPWTISRGGTRHMAPACRAWWHSDRPAWRSSTVPRIHASATWRRASRRANRWCSRPPRGMVPRQPCCAPRSSMARERTGP